MISFERYTVLSKIITTIGTMTHYDGLSFFGNDYKMNVHGNEGFLYYNNKVLVNFIITNEFWESKVILLPEVDPWMAAPYFNFRLKEGRGTDVIPIYRRYGTDILEFNVLDDISTDEDVFDSSCFQNSLLHDGVDHYAIMYEPFARKLRIPGSSWRLYEHLFDDCVNFQALLKLVQLRNPHE